MGQVAAVRRALVGLLIIAAVVIICVKFAPGMFCILQTAGYEQRWERLCACRTAMSFEQ